MSDLGSETVTYRLEAVEDDYGNPTTPGASEVFTGCAVYPRGTSTEDDGRAATVIDGYTILIPPRYTTPISPRGQFEWARQPGVWRKVVGNPGLWPFLDGSLAATQVNVSGEAG